MTVVDVLVLGTLGVGLILGMVRGFLAQFTGLAGLAGGLLLAERYYPVLRRTALDPWLHAEHNGEIAFISIVVFTVLVAAVIGWLVGKALAKLQLGAYDRFMGGAFGLLKSGLICAAVLLAVVYFSPDGGSIEKHIGSSKSAPMLWRAMTRVAGALPERYRGDVRGFLEENQPLHSETARGE